LLMNDDIFVSYGESQKISGRQRSCERSGDVRFRDVRQREFEVILLDTGAVDRECADRQGREAPRRRASRARRVAFTLR
jgi:hypothetical protein